MTRSRPTPARPRLRALRAAPMPAPPMPPPGTARRPDLERWLYDLGADPAFAEAVLGDLAEEYALRAADQGVAAARRWYVREALRSAPHLAWSALRHLGPHGRARLAAQLAPYAAAGAVAATAVGLAWRALPGPPARLVAGAAADGVVVNNDQRAAQLPMRVLDAAGHVLPDTGVRYRWESGVPFPVSPGGAVTCTRPGDAVVRAALGRLATRVVVHCVPVHDLVEAGSNDFVLGDPPRPLAVGAVDEGGRPVTRLAAWLHIADSTVATVDDWRIRPLRPGATRIRVDAGNHWLTTTVTVYEPVRAFVGLGPDQRFVAVRVRLVPGASVRYALPTGVFMLATLPGPNDQGANTQAGPTLTLAGPVVCRAAFGSAGDRAECLARMPGATVTVGHPAAAGAGTATSAVVGTLALERIDPREVLRPWIRLREDPAFVRAVDAFAWREPD